MNVPNSSMSCSTKDQYIILNYVKVLVVAVSQWVNTHSECQQNACIMCCKLRRVGWYKLSVPILTASVAICFQVFTLLRLWFTAVWQCSLIRIFMEDMSCNLYIHSKIAVIWHVWETGHANCCKNSYRNPIQYSLIGKAIQY